jgi:hypothetical protein
MGNGQHRARQASYAFVGAVHGKNGGARWIVTREKEVEVAPRGVGTMLSRTTADKNKEMDNLRIITAGDSGRVTLTRWEVEVAAVAVVAVVDEGGDTEEARNLSRSEDKILEVLVVVDMARVEERRITHSLINCSRCLAVGDNQAIQTTMRMRTRTEVKMTTVIWKAATTKTRRLSRGRAVAAVNMMTRVGVANTYTWMRMEIL